MNSFIEQVAIQLQARHGSDYKDVIIISPNRRAALFLQRKMSQLQQAPIWSPQLMTMDQVVKSFSPFAEADRLTVVYQIFRLWSKRSPTSEQFEKFYALGDRIFRDFDLIEKYRVPSEQLFSNLSDEKMIEQQFSDWRDEMKEYLKEFHQSLLVETGEQPELIEKFLEFWTQLGSLKRELDQALEERQITYAGRMYKALADQPEQLQEWNAKTLYFIGFNRLNDCESSIMNYAVHHLNAEVFWNIDQAIMPSSKWNNAGLFQRKVPDHPRHHRIDANRLGHQKTVNIHGIQKNAAQAKWLAELLKKQSIHPEKTVIILPNEHLLLPLLSCIPENISKINVSMGVSLKETPVFTLLEAYLKLHEGFDTRASTGVYHKEDILRLLEHPYIPFDIDFGKDKSRYFTPDELISKVKPEWANLFKPLQGVKASETFHYFRKSLEALHAEHVANRNSSGGLAEYIAEVIVFAHQKWTRLGDLFVEEQMDLHFESLMNLIRQYFRNARIPFRGEPLEGLQILGPLEARNLDFEQVYVPNLNEGIFPGAPKQSVIPFHLRKAFGLPTQEEETAEEAYYFYMALARANKVDLLYNTMTDDTGSKEVSRFIQYIRLRADHWQTKEIKLSQAVNAMNQDEIVIQKSDSDIQKMKEFFESGVSPSALNTYLDCSLKFYFQRVLGLWTDVDVDGLFNPLYIGSVLHKTMELLYLPLKGKAVTSEIIEGLERKMDGALAAAMKKELGLERPYQNRGEAFMIHKTVRESVERILQYDKKSAPFIMHEPELDLGKMDVHLQIGEWKVKIKGIVDRIDEQEGKLRLFDYKTGSEGYKNKSGAILGSFEKAYSLEDRSKRHKLAIQLSMYALALKNAPSYHSKLLQPAHFLTREMYAVESYDHRFEKEGGVKIDYLEKEDFEQIEAQLATLLKEMVDPSIHFEQTANLTACNYCPYRQICKRDKQKF